MGTNCVRFKSNKIKGRSGAKKMIFSLLNVVLFIALSFLLILKLSEIVFHLCYALIRAEEYRKNLIDIGARDSIDGEDIKGIWPVTTLINSCKLVFSKFYLIVIFRYRYLMLAEATIVTYSETGWILIVGASLVLIGIWIEIARLLCDRLMFGSYDGPFRGALGQKIRPNAYKTLFDRSSIMQTRQFISLFSQLTGVVVFGYAAVYCAIDIYFGSSGAFSGIPHDIWRLPNLLYFSTITFATVGYGDIVPTNLVSRAVVASEVASGFALVVVLISSVSLSSGGE